MVVVAQDAPIGVQLWPTTSPRYAANFTLASVQVVSVTLRDASGTYASERVVWTYESGTTRTFDVGTEVAVQLAVGVATA